MASVNDVTPNAMSMLALTSIQVSSASLSSSTASAGQLTGPGPGIIYMANVGSTPGSYATRTAAQMQADSSWLGVGQTYILILANNQGTGTLTLTAGSNVTVAGTATVAVNTARVFVVTTPTATTMVFTGLAIGFGSNS